MGLEPDRYDEAKLAELVVLVAGRLSDDRAGGATKLNKVLYFADFAHFRRTGRSITGAEYQKLPQGPAPRRLLPVREKLLRDHSVELRIETFLGYTQHRLVPLRDADAAIFSAEELETVDEVLADLRNLTAKQVSDLSHAEPGWLLVDEGEVIPYEASLIAPRQHGATPAIAARGAEIAVAYGLASD